MSKPGPLCHQCPLKDAPGPVWGTGSPNPQAVFIGMGPAENEIQEGVPFSGPSGNTLNNGFRAAGIERSRQYLTNLVRCFVPPGTPVPPEAIRCCKPLLDKELDAVGNPDITVTLGSEPFKTFTGKNLQTVITKKARKDPSFWLRGCPFPITGKRIIIPLFHPSYLLRTGFRDTWFFERDLAKVKRWIDGKGFPVWDHIVTNYQPSERDVIDYVQKILDKGWFGCDIETPDDVFEEEDRTGQISGQTEIQVIGLSADLGESIGVPASLFPLLVPLFEGKRARKPICCVFNWGFDGYHLATHFDLSGIRPADGMLALNFLYSDATSKSLGTAMSVFTDCPFTKNLAQRDPNLYNAYDTFGALWVVQEAVKELEARGMSKLFWEHGMDLWPVVEMMRVQGVNCDTEHAQRMELQCSMALEKYIEIWNKLNPMVMWSSPKQLMEFFNALGYKPQYNMVAVKGTKKKVRRQTVDDDALEVYITQNKSQAALLIREMRTLKKSEEFTYFYAEDGRAHAQVSIVGQRAGRLQAKDPDLQNIPEEIGGIFPRSIVIPDFPDTQVVIHADFEQIEFFVYGYAAQDKPILEAKRNGIYLYGLFYEEIFQKPFFEQGRPPLKQYRRSSVEPWELLVAKSGPLGLLYGRQADSLQKGFGIAKDKAFKMYDNFFKEHWAISALHTRLISEAYKNGHLKNFFGRIRWFPNVRMLRNEILAFPGQSNAADVLIQNALVPLGRDLPAYDSRLMLTVHDQVAACGPRSKAAVVGDYVRECMERPVPEMDNFFFTATLKIGSKETSKTGLPNWNDVIAYEDWIAQYGSQRSGTIG